MAGTAPVSARDRGKSSRSARRETPTAHSRSLHPPSEPSACFRQGQERPGGAGQAQDDPARVQRVDYRFPSLFRFTYAKIFFVITEGPMGVLPMIFSIESLQPLKLIAYPPNAAFPLFPFLFFFLLFAIPSPPSNRLWGASARRLPIRPRV